MCSVYSSKRCRGVHQWCHGASCSRLAVKRTWSSSFEASPSIAGVCPTLLACLAPGHDRRKGEALHSLVPRLSFWEREPGNKAILYSGRSPQQEGMSNYENKSALTVLVVDHIGQVGIRTAAHTKVICMNQWAGQHLLRLQEGQLLLRNKHGHGYI